ncbi:MAG: hypothetical protein ACD_28C00116G0004, partial [uncultured bacterium]
MKTSFSIEKQKNQSFGLQKRNAFFSGGVTEIYFFHIRLPLLPLLHRPLASPFGKSRIRRRVSGDFGFLTKFVGILPSWNHSSIFGGPKIQNPRQSMFPPDE